MWWIIGFVVGLGVGGVIGYLIGSAVVTARTEFERALQRFCDPPMAKMPNSVADHDATVNRVCDSKLYN